MAQAESNKAPGWCTASSEGALRLYPKRTHQFRVPQKIAVEHSNASGLPKGRLEWRGGRLAKRVATVTWTIRTRNVTPPARRNHNPPPTTAFLVSLKNTGGGIPSKAIYSSGSSSFSSNSISASTKKSPTPSPPSTKNIGGGVHSKVVFAPSSLVVSLNETEFVRQVG